MRNPFHGLTWAQSKAACYVTWMLLLLCGGVVVLVEAETNAPPQPWERMLYAALLGSFLNLVLVGVLWVTLPVDKAPNKTTFTRAYGSLRGKLKDVPLNPPDDV